VPTAAQPQEEQVEQTLETLLVRLPSDLKEQVRQRASKEERTQAQVVRRALRHYLTEVSVNA
jgi:predicted DNA-binding protein